MSHLPRVAVSAGIFALAAVANTACAARLALPSPFPMTYGGTTIPARGVAGGLEFGDGLSGQEVERTEILSLNLGASVADRISVSGAIFGEKAAFETFSDEPSGSLWRIKARLGELFGPRSSVAAHVAIATIDRKILPAQDESVRTLDFSAPAEFLLTEPVERFRGSVYAGPRLTFESYRDHLDQRQDAQHLYGGVLTGAHLSYGILHLFGEATLLYVPHASFHDVTYGGRLTVMPAVGVLLRIGPDHKWDRR